MNYLSKNIRYLRKSRKWSQETLAQKMGVKRSSIAAYESKNVRPRLDFIVELARLFEVRMSELIERDMEKNGAPEEALPKEKTAKRKPAGGKVFFPDLNIQDRESLNEFVERSLRIRKMLEGFMAFYRFKLENYDQYSSNNLRSLADIENFLLLTEHLLSHNDVLIRAISGPGALNGAGAAG